MITFRETLDGLQNVSEMLKSATEAETSVDRALTGLSDLRAMLESPRAKDPASSAEFISRVVLPQLIGLRDALEVGSSESFKRLRAASDQSDRLILRLQMLVDGSVDGLL